MSMQSREVTASASLRNCEADPTRPRHRRTLACGSLDLTAVSGFGGVVRGAGRGAVGPRGPVGGGERRAGVPFLARARGTVGNAGADQTGNGAIPPRDPPGDGRAFDGDQFLGVPVRPSGL